MSYSKEAGFESSVGSLVHSGRAAFVGSQPLVFSRPVSAGAGAISKKEIQGPFYARDRSSCSDIGRWLKTSPVGENMEQTTLLSMAGESHSSAEEERYDVGDVTVAADRKRWLSQIREAERTGPSVLVNNAGQNTKAEAVATSDEEVESLLRTHVFASFAVSRDVQPDTAAAGRGLAYG